MTGPTEAERPTRERDPQAKRERIADAALELFTAKGFAKTTIDDIAAAAKVGRRTVFHHFPSKQAILFDHLVVQREAAIERLAERPEGEPPLVSLHAVFRELAVQGFDRRLLTQIRNVLAEGQVRAEEPSVAGLEFQRKLVGSLDGRGSAAYSLVELHALAEMVSGWFLTATRMYFKGERGSLVQCYDEAVAACVRDVVDLRPDS